MAVKIAEKAGGFGSLNVSAGAHLAVVLGGYGSARQASLFGGFPHRVRQMEATAAALSGDEPRV